MDRRHFFCVAMLAENNAIIYPSQAGSNILSVFTTPIPNIPVNYDRRLRAVSASHPLPPPTQIKQMGAYSSSLTSSPASKGIAGPTSKAPVDSTPEAPNRNQRVHCWEARDAFFRCLDQNSIIDSIADHELAREQCSKEGVAFEESCASSWVSSFLPKFSSAPPRKFYTTGFVWLLI